MPASKVIDDGPNNFINGGVVSFTSTVLVFDALLPELSWIL